jgi:monoamine oxidase
VPNPDVDVIVVGAGIAGLTAAWRLLSEGHSVAVFEANDRVGGRLYGYQVGERAVQLGGRWTGPGQDRIKSLAAELGINICANTTFSDASIGRAGEDAERVAEAVHKLDEIAGQVPLEAPWLAPNAHELDSQTLATWLATNCDPDIASTVGDLLAGFLPKASDVSLLHTAFYLHSNGGLSGILGLNGPAHDSEMFDGGAHQLTDRLGEKLGSHIHLNTPVTQICQDQDGVRITSRDVEMSARFAIVALPPTLASRLIYDPAMSPERDYLTQRMPIRGKIVVALLYDRPFWRDEGHRLIETDRLLLWDEGGDQKPAALSGLISIDWSRELWNIPAEDRRAAIIDEVSTVLGPKTRQCNDYHEIYWAAEPWSRGCNSYMTTGAWTAWGQALREPVGRIHWAGAEISPQFVGQMDGAVRSAETAVDAICSLTKTGERNGG